MAAGTKEDPWLLKTPPGASCYSTYKDPQANTTSGQSRTCTRGLAGRTAGFPSPRPMFGISLPPMPEESG